MLSKRKTLQAFILASISYLGCFSNAHAYYPIGEDSPFEGIYPKYPVIDYGKGPEAEIIKRGEYLAKTGDCLACHTDDVNHGKPYAGGLGMETPFGMFYSPNITPDKETGIGNWTKEQFINAMRHGKSPSGENYFPVFPYVYFNKMTESDLHALWVYMQHVPAVKQKNKPHGVPFPFNVRLAQYGWKTLFFYPYEGEYKYDPSKSKEWNRGAYLVDGPGHCAMCHSPLNLLGAPIQKYYLTGGFIEGYWAPNITSDGLAKISAKEIADVFVSGQRLNKAGPIAGPMAQVNHNSLRHLTEEDRLAMAVYLKSVHSFQPHGVEPSKEQDPIKRGKQIYINSCIICHKSGTAGAPVLGNESSWSERLEREGLPMLYRHTINGFNNMPIKGACVTCSDKDITAAVDYILATSIKEPKLQKILKEGAKKTPEKIDGAIVYKENCAVCHDTGSLGAPKNGDTAAWHAIIENKNIDTLILNTLQGIGNMPAKGSCKYCTNAEIIAAVKYLVDQNKTKGDYKLW